MRAVFVSFYQNPYMSCCSLPLCIYEYISALFFTLLTWNDKVKCDLAFCAGLYDFAFQLLSTPPLKNTLEAIGGVTVGEHLKTALHMFRELASCSLGVLSFIK